MNKQKGLEEMRAEIDLIDNALLRLLEARKRKVAIIADRKAKNGMATLDPTREEQIIATLLQSSTGVFDDTELQHMFRDIIERCRPVAVAHR